MTWLRFAGPIVLAVLAVLLVDRAMERRGLLPPLFRPGTAGEPPSVAGLRRLAAALVLLALFWVALFAPLALIGQAPQVDFDTLGWPQLFLVHGLLFVTLALWHVCAFVPLPGCERVPGGGALQQYGLRARSFWTEVGVGLSSGLAVWLGVVLLLVAVAAGMSLIGGEESLPLEPSPLIPWLASLPLGLRLAVSASAGFFEELFFRGFLQPRVGIGLSSALFVLAHASYEQPLMLVGVTVLSLVFAYLVRLRQSIWAAVVAHAVFDAVQLGIVIPRALDLLEGSLT